MSSRRDEVVAGQVLPPLAIDISARRIVMGAAASRDWQPQHHDHAVATGPMNLPDIIMNTPTQAGWLSKYVTDWSGPAARIARMRFRMLSPVCPRDALVVAGRVSAVAPAREGWRWVQIDVTMRRAGVVATEAALLLALPFEQGASPWRAEPWCPPAWLI